MDKNLKGIIAISVLGIIGFLGYKYLSKKGILGSAKSIANDNFALLQKQLPAKPNKDGVIVVPFNGKKNKAAFYSNNRVIIFDTTKNPPVRIKSGIYSQGGYSITLDGGKDIMNTSSVWGALAETIK
jgi:hypothetical protein